MLIKFLTKKGEKMRKSVLSFISILVLSGMAYGGGDIASMEENIPEQSFVNESAFYIGLGIGKALLNNDSTDEEFTSAQLMLQAGYQYNQYIAIEGRYTFGFNTDYNQGSTLPVTSYGDISSWGIYVKPMYPVTEAFDIYALLGYGGVMLSDINNGDAYEDGFQWGLGAQYAIMENVSVFVDYVTLYDNTGFDYVAQDDDLDSDVWTLGVTYKF